MSAVSVSESGVRPILADAVDLARRALLELEPAGVGAHLGVAAEDESAATHRFEATLPGYRGWQWAVVVAAPPAAEYATVSESALLPGPDALVAPDFVPWDQRIRPGDLAPGDLLAPPPNDPRLVPGYVANGDPVVDEVALEIGLGRTQVMSLEGRADAAERWHAEYGPDTEMAKAAPSTCGLCGFYLPLAGSLRAAFGVCGNAMGADGRVVHAAYGCGAHSDTVAPTGGGSPLYEAYDDAAVELIPTADLRVQTPVDEAPTDAAPAKSAESAAGTDDSSATAGVAADAHESADPTAGPTVEVAAVPPRAAAESAAPTTAPGEPSDVDTAAGESGTASADATAAAAGGEGDSAGEATISDVAPGTPDTEPGAAPVANGEPTVEVPVASPRGDVETAGADVVSVGGSESPATQQAEVEAPPAAHEPTTSGVEGAAPSDTVAAQPTADVVAAVAADDTAAAVASESARAYAESSGAEIVSAGAADSAREVSPEATDPLAPVGETQPLADASAAADGAAAESGAAASGAQQVGDEGRCAGAGFEAHGSDAEQRGDAAEGGADESSRQG
ncbi:hypothetical protein FG87_03760 [Nocardia vulneris]|uniref:DUF3027 domain-containing protein n=1 Tax=Nocardia vulneris TaxID=1141657 RepID=A0ABR4ZLV4_9NOCA|nr:hypothetical protein FG87_03760 [Nocardia vulneris]